MKRRRLNEDDLALWRRVTERTEKLELNKLFTQEIDAPAPAPPQVRRAKIALQGNKPQPTMKKRSNDLRPTLSEQMKAAPVQMDHKAFGKLKRGKLRPEGRIDLHGMTLDRAHPALNGRSRCATACCAIRCRNGCRCRRSTALCFRLRRPMSATAAAGPITSISGATVSRATAAYSV